MAPLSRSSTWTTASATRRAPAPAARLRDGPQLAEEVPLGQGAHVRARGQEVVERGGVAAEEHREELLEQLLHRRALLGGHGLHRRALHVGPGGRRRERRVVVDREAPASVARHGHGEVARGHDLVRHRGGHGDERVRAVDRLGARHGGLLDDLVGALVGDLEAGVVAQAVGQVRAKGDGDPLLASGREREVGAGEGDGEGPRLGVVGQRTLGGARRGAAGLRARALVDEGGDAANEDQGHGEPEDHAADRPHEIAAGGTTSHGRLPREDPPVLRRARLKVP